MSSTSAVSLSDGALPLTTRNNVGQRPPAIAARSPLDELLIDEVSEMLPPPLAEALRTSTSMDRIQDWLAAAALYPLVAEDTHLAGRFVEAVRRDPRQANQKLMRAMAQRAQPPQREAAWHRLDQTGLLLQLTVALLLLLARGCVFFLLAVILAHPIDTVWGERLLSIGSGLEFLLAPPRHVFWSPLVLTFAALWLALEAVMGPALFESLRQIPAATRDMAPPLSWRSDAFHVAWYAQASGLCLLISLRAGWLFASALFQGVLTPHQAIIGHLLLVLISLSLCVLFAYAPRILSLGTTSLDAE